LGTVREGERVAPVVAEGAELRKPDWPLQLEAVSRMLTAGQELKMEIPATHDQQIILLSTRAMRKHASRRRTEMHPNRCRPGSQAGNSGPRGRIL
jgi:hypothetical protein